MKYSQGAVEVRGTIKMIPTPNMTYRDFIDLPNLTEVLFLDVAPHGLGLRVQIIDVTHETREESLEKMEEAGNNLDDQMPYSLAVVLLPDEIPVPDFEELTNHKFTSLGERHGREGSMMLSEALLRAQFAASEWNANAYNAYMNAYKAAVAKRRGK